VVGALPLECAMGRGVALLPARLLDDFGRAKVKRESGAAAAVPPELVGRGAVDELGSRPASGRDTAERDGDAACSASRSKRVGIAEFLFRRGDRVRPKRADVRDRRVNELFL